MSSRVPLISFEALAVSSAITTFFAVARIDGTRQARFGITNEIFVRGIRALMTIIGISTPIITFRARTLIFPT